MPSFFCDGLSNKLLYKLTHSGSCCFKSRPEYNKIRNKKGLTLSETLVIDIIHGAT